MTTCPESPNCADAEVAMPQSCEHKILAHTTGLYMMLSDLNPFSKIKEVSKITWKNYL